MKSIPPNEDDQLARLGQELKTGTWVKNARHRSRRRRSPWNLLLPLFALPLWVAIAFMLGWVFSGLHGLLSPATAPLFASGPLSFPTALVIFPALLSALCPALLLTNFLVYRVPPARRAMDAEDLDHPGTDYASSQRALSKLGAWVGAVCLPIALVGVSIA
jgi:H+/gluconate symporter-like permease